MRLTSIVGENFVIPVILHRVVVTIETALESWFVSTLISYRQHFITSVSSTRMLTHVVCVCVCVCVCAACT